MKKLMPNLLSINTVKDLMQRHEMKFSKGLGQNFLVDRPALQKIVKSANPQPEDIVLEIGPGVGTLTNELCKQVKQVYAVEIDQRLMPILAETLADFNNVKVHLGDILKTDLRGLISYSSHEPLKVIANLPYYITTPTIFRLLESEISWDRMVFLVQREVAERLAAKHGSKLYGASSVNIQARAKVFISGIVKPGCFIPRPKVDSAIIVIEPKKELLDPQLDFKLLKSVVQKAFSQRRKKLFNSLSTKGELVLTKELWRNIFLQCNIEESVRAEQLTVDKFIELAKCVASSQN
ncbi:16S rRNA (adenine(1518)-N(6)/adenine(1519)-N(6))-dimethyltransferase RsmA [Clostridium sp. 'deep sea']|uniref:16S rRNA (adenine(1518)-N(6)/adenine(1519)-N(6))- dimethyltransferase RsmA n=1 Tax=Clostridium sp. 'deep sea' TaxID=2779445 RepID=UPI0018963F11|nr:16S rRNA (adenine(1518)-N(6)/adenine(1519)-N(6))-dimethyltransferase RsmA [Clostridium sp. 'deep sea']QOR34501.1 16S rRNA (adenine(1518)-N(6)/adenine(1519)-N(6))-dimethyltransferase RsmA [Clostridium sp. 'deep sea']